MYSEKKKDIDLERLNYFQNLRKKILQMAFDAGSSSAHFGGALSIVEILSILFGYRMDLKKNNNNKKELKDRFILSKGHACLAYYASLNLLGFISDEELKTFEKDNSSLAGHPVKNKELELISQMAHWEWVYLLVLVLLFPQRKN